MCLAPVPDLTVCALTADFPEPFAGGELGVCSRRLDKLHQASRSCLVVFQGTTRLPAQPQNSHCSSGRKLLAI